MGIAAYNRGTRAIRQQIDREFAAGARRLGEYDKGLLDGRRESGAVIRALEKELDRAVRALRLEAAKLSEERHRAARAVELLEELRAREALGR